MLLTLDNTEYFRTVSTKAAAMTKLLRTAIDDSLKDVSASEMDFLKQALADLTNGNYLGSGENVQYQTVTIEALKNFENAIREMLLTAEHQYMYLSSSTVKELGFYNVELSDFLPEQIIPVFKQRIADIRQGGNR